MKGFAKGLSVFIGMCDYGVGIVVALTLILKLDSVSIIYINGMSTNESLLLNTAVFTLILAAIGVVLNSFVGADGKSEGSIEFPLVYEALPVIVAGIIIFYAFQGETGREKLLMVVFAVLYALLSAVVILFASKMFQIFPKEKK